MVAARKGDSDTDISYKRSAPSSNGKPTTSNKKAKTEKLAKDGHLEVGDDGQLGFKDEKEDNKDEQDTRDTVDEGKDERMREIERKPTTAQPNQSGEQSKSLKGETKQEGDEIDLKAGSSGDTLQEPKHGTLESGHVFFLYRPKIDAEKVDSVDEVSKFHILLIPTSSPHDHGHCHRIIEVGKKKLPEPGAKRQVIWGLVGRAGTDKSALKTAFGAYDYDTKTKGKRHQSAARPAARGHYILHSPRDPLADDPNRNRQRDFKCLLAYEITTPTREDFGNVQSELGLEEKGAVGLQVKDPDVEGGSNPRAAGIPREKRAQYPSQLKQLFGDRRWIPANPTSLLDYSGTELLILSSPHTLVQSLGKNGQAVEHDLDQDAEEDTLGVDAAMKELGMSKKDTEIEALEGEWA